jgi:hypothetical protein
MAKEENKKFTLNVPLDAGGIENFKPDLPVKVLLQQCDALTHEQIVKLDRQGKGSANFSFVKHPGALRLVVGPGDALAEELLGLQTLSYNLSSRQWGGKEHLKLSPIKIPPYYWHWWHRWCRTFTITGHLVCANGEPVPGAKVCAYDVDMWWWWFSRQLVGCDTTDETGAFEIKFRWCCGWWPWWWWGRRFWQLEPRVADHILQKLRQFKYVKLPQPRPTPDSIIFEELLGENIAPSPKAQVPCAPSRAKTFTHLEPPALARAAPAIDPDRLEELGVRLAERIPRIPELEPLRLWPWWPWHPWWDCTPDIIFRATQICRGEERVIVAESGWDTRWNIPTTLNVTLVANDRACCIEDSPQPEGNCINLTHACSVPVSNIGGNLSAPGAPLGYVNPGAVASNGDRPFAGNMSIWGDFGTLASAHYYEFEWSTDGATWDPMPAGTFSGFVRLFFGPPLPGPGPIGTYSVPFNMITLPAADGDHHVIESRQHFEDHNGAGTWEVPGPGSRWWMNHKNLLGIWLTENNFTDGTYRLRVKSWELVTGQLENPQILGQCGTDPEQANSLILTLDNRVIFGGPADIYGHPCGAGTVHTCTTEPEAAILAVKIIHADGTESEVGVCGDVPVQEGDQLQIDFVAHDPDGHLSYYTLQTTYDLNLANNLLALGGTLAPSPLAPAWAPAPPAAQVGPSYANARAGGAVAPTWHGGAIRLTVDAKKAFPKTCCYQLELRTHKRTIYHCDMGLHTLWGHTNYTEYSFLVNVI